MYRFRAMLATVVTYSLLILPVNGAPPAAMGTITAATSAHVGAVSATTGSTIFSGDHLSTERFGTLQVRAGSARFLLSSASGVAVGDNPASPSARLLYGTVVFSTANSKSFVLNASTAQFRPKTDEPTVAQVTYVNDKELQVRSTRGAVAVTVDDETKYVAEGMAYRVILDPDEYYAKLASEQQGPGPQGAGAEKRKEPRKAGRSRFLLIAMIITGVATGVAVYEAVQSPDSPN